MAIEAHLEIIKSGVNQWNTWREENPDIQPDLSLADLSKAELYGANFSEVIFNGANLSKTNLDEADLSKANLREAKLTKASLVTANLNKADLRNANLREAILWFASLSSVDLRQADLFRAELIDVDLINANLNGALLNEVNLTNSRLMGANLNKVNLTGADVSLLQLIDSFGVGPFMIDMTLKDVNLSSLDAQFSTMKLLGEEFKANQKIKGRENKNNRTRSMEYSDATRANRQLKVALSEQGLDNEAAKFAYRGQITNRKYLWFLAKNNKIRGKKIKLFSQWLISWLLFLLAGYGYGLGRAIASYLIVIFSFGLVFWIGTKGDFVNSIVESVNIFHGRGISTSASELISKEYWLLITAAFEATIGLIIEVTFIAALTQRLFGK